MVWVGLVLPGLPSAACFNGNPSPETELRNSEFVFVGEVISETFTPANNQYFEGKTYAVRVIEVLRGKPKKVFRLFSENSSGRFPMQVGSKYLIFAHDELGRLQVDNCGNSGALTEQAELLKTLRKVAP